jgi:16S rRNA (guanine527-N7)-methyltransferase
MSPELADRLARRLGAVGAPADRRAVEALGLWLDLHGRWSRAFNLTGTRDPAALVDLHLTDCAALLPLLPDGPLLDLGSGAGLPGLVIALLQPERPMILVDSSAKRTRFLEQVVLEAALRQVVVETTRVEDYRASREADATPLAGVLVRAVAPLARLVDSAGHLLADGTPLLAMKGPAWRGEAEALPDEFVVRGVQDYRLPLDGETGEPREHVLVTVGLR